MRERRFVYEADHGFWGTVLAKEQIYLWYYLIQSSRNTIMVSEKFINGPGMIC